MDPLQRVQAVIDGRLPDRPPVSFWHHFPPQQIGGSAAVAAHLDQLREYDLDFLKVMNDNPYPHAGLVGSIVDLASITELRGDEAEFQRQLDLLADLRRELRGRVLMTTTLFNAWTVLRHLIRPPSEHNPPELDAAADAPSAQIREMLAVDELAVRTAIGQIGRSLANFARRCIEAGADGIFLSVRDDWVDSPQPGVYARVVRSADLEVLDAARAGRFNMVHVCGRAVDFRSLADYPAHVINWADRAAGPSIASVKDWVKPAICAGVDNLSTLPNGTPEDVEREVADALRQAGSRPIMIAPGCTYDPAKVPAANLQAMARAAHAHVYDGEHA